MRFFTVILLLALLILPAIAAEVQETSISCFWPDRYLKLEEFDEPPSVMFDAKTLGSTGTGDGFKSYSYAPYQIAVFKFESEPDAISALQERVDEDNLEELIINADLNAHWNSAEEEIYFHYSVSYFRISSLLGFSKETAVARVNDLCPQQSPEPEPDPQPEEVTEEDRIGEQDIQVLEEDEPEVEEIEQDEQINEEPVPSPELISKEEQPKEEQQDFSLFIIGAIIGVVMAVIFIKFFK